MRPPAEPDLLYVPPRHVSERVPYTTQIELRPPHMQSSDITPEIDIAAVVTVFRPPWILHLDNEAPIYQGIQSILPRPMQQVFRETR